MNDSLILKVEIPLGSDIVKNIVPACALARKLGVCVSYEANGFTFVCFAEGRAYRSGRAKDVGPPVWFQIEGGSVWKLESANGEKVERCC